MSGHLGFSYLNLTEDGVHVQDLTGPTFERGVRGVGLGTVIVNTGIAFLQHHTEFAGMSVHGILSPQGDPDDSWTADRERFAQSFGATAPGRRFRVPVAELRQVPPRARHGGRDFRVSWDDFSFADAKDLPRTCGTDAWLI